MNKVDPFKVVLILFVLGALAFCVHKLWQYGAKADAAASQEWGRVNKTQCHSSKDGNKLSKECQRKQMLRFENS
jgi:hypothetical protein